jgi:hypothetical protein
VRALQLDDHESLLLAAWVRTGWWAAPGAAGVDRALVSTSAAAAPTLALRVAGGRLAATLTLDPDTYLPARMTQPLCGGVEAWEYSRWTPWPGAARGALFPGATAHAGTAGGGNAFHVERVEEAEAVREGEARAAAGGGARRAVAAAAAVEAAVAVDAGPALEFAFDGLPTVAPPAGAPARARRPSRSPYARPPKPARAPGATFDVAASPLIDAHWTQSGHLLVRPTLDGRPAAGFFILDSGASGLCVDAAAADAMDWPAFGELHVTGVAGAVPARFRRGASFGLGPLTLADPLFMEMPLAGLVSGGPGPVLGIAGHDVFRAAVVTLPPPPAAGGRRPRAPRGGTRTAVRIEDPVGYVPPSAAGGRWARLVMVANLPHVEARVPGAPPPSSPSRRALLMLDSGAGGVDVMFHARAAAELGLGGGARAPRAVRGVGAASGADPVAATPHTLPWLRLGGHTFGGPIQSLISGPGGFDLSLYSAGVACADLVSRAGTILDVSRRRVAFLPAPGDRPASPRDARQPRRGVPPPG